MREKLKKTLHFIRTGLTVQQSIKIAVNGEKKDIIPIYPWIISQLDIRKEEREREREWKNNQFIQWNQTILKNII